MDSTNAEPLLTEFPAWRQFARHEDDDGHSYLVIEVPVPEAANVERALLMTTANDEVTIGFDAYHSHFDDCVGEFEGALEFVRQLISERVAVVSWWQDEEWRGSTTVEAGAEPGFPSWASSQRVNRIRVRSWNGTHNADVNV